MIFLANIYDPTDGIGDTVNAGLPRWSDGLKIHGAYNRLIAEAAERRENVTLIDMQAEFLGHGIHSRQFWQPFYQSEDPGYWYFDNLEDPNDRGYDALRRLFLDEMSQTLPATFDLRHVRVRKPTTEARLPIDDSTTDKNRSRPDERGR